MAFPTKSFIGQYGQVPIDMNAPANMDQYIQQGQSQISPGQAQVAASNPITAAAGVNLGNALQQSQQQGTPAQQGGQPSIMQQLGAFLGQGSGSMPNMPAYYMGKNIPFGGS